MPHSPTLRAMVGIFPVASSISLCTLGNENGCAWDWSLGESQNAALSCKPRWSCHFSWRWYGVDWNQVSKTSLPLSKICWNKLKMVRVRWVLQNHQWQDEIKKNSCILLPMPSIATVCFINLWVHYSSKEFTPTALFKQSFWRTHLCFGRENNCYNNCNNNRQQQHQLQRHQQQQRRQRQRQRQQQQQSSSWKIGSDLGQPQSSLKQLFQQPLNLRYPLLESTPLNKNRSITHPNISREMQIHRTFLSTEPEIFQQQHRATDFLLLAFNSADEPDQNRQTREILEKACHQPLFLMTSNVLDRSLSKMFGWLWNRGGIY